MPILKRSFAVLCLILCGNAFAMPAVDAQPAVDIATDQELFAAYCLGATRALADMPSITKQLKNLGVDPGREITDGERETTEILNRELSRRREYLAARGFLSGSRAGSAGVGIQLAIKRGRSDAERCFAKIDTCVSKCSARRPYLPKCTHDCRDEENACRATDRCNRDDTLPF